MNKTIPHSINVDNVTGIGIDCPDCKSKNIKVSFLPNGFYDCICIGCGAKFVVPVMHTYMLKKKDFYNSIITSNEYKSLFGLKDEIFKEFLPLISFFAFTILTIISTISLNSYLRFPFATAALVSLVLFIIQKIRKDFN